MNDKQKEILIRWLNDAFAMEQQNVEVLKRQKDQVKGFPDVQGKIQEHVDTTQQQAEKVKECIQNLGGNISQTKEALGNIMGMGQGMSTAVADDKVIKDGIADLATEHFERASYMAIIAAAEALEQNEVADVCKEIMEEEKEMGEWLEGNLPDVVRKYISQVS